MLVVEPNDVIHVLFPWSNKISELGFRNVLWFNSHLVVEWLNTTYNIVMFIIPFYCPFHFNIYTILILNCSLLDFPLAKHGKNKSFKSVFAFTVIFAVNVRWPNSTMCSFALYLRCIIFATMQCNV